MAGDAGLPAMGSNPRLRGMIRDCLIEGVARGDVRPEIDLELAVDLLVGTYAWNYRLAAAEGADAERLTALFDRQVGLIFQGLSSSALIRRVAPAVRARNFACLAAAWAPQVSASHPESRR